VPRVQLVSIDLGRAGRHVMPRPSPYPAYPASSGGVAHYRGHEALEEANQNREDELKGKIGALKSLTIDIGAEVREHNRLLKDTDDGFDKAAGLLGVSIAKVLGLAKSGNRFHLLYLFLFCLFVFFVVWLLK